MWNSLVRPDRKGMVVNMHTYTHVFFFKYILSSQNNKNDLNSKEGVWGIIYSVVVLDVKIYFSSILCINVLYGHLSLIYRAFALWNIACGTSYE